MYKITKVGLVDDHVLLRKGLASLVRGFGYEVHLECDHGKDLMKQLDAEHLPDIILMDINMPEMDGYETSLWLKQNFPLVPVLALSMYDDETAIIRMLKNGARGYVLKDADPGELRTAIDAVIKRGFHYSEMVTGRLMHSLQHMDDATPGADGEGGRLNEREKEFLKYAGTELTYKEIALEMHVSPRTIDGYRDALFEKLHVKSRVGLVLYALKKGILPLTY